MNANYKVYLIDKGGDPKDVTFSGENPIPLEVILGMNVGKTIALYLAKALEKDWIWNESYPQKIAVMIADLVGEAMNVE